MPRQNTSPSDFPPAILQQIARLAAHIVAARKARGETQVQWAEQLGISQPTMARLERGDASVSAATYIMCLWRINPQLDLTQLLPAATRDALPTTSAHPEVPHNSAVPSDVDDFAALFASWTPAKL